MANIACKNCDSENNEILDIVESESDDENDTYVIECPECGGVVGYES